MENNIFHVGNENIIDFDRNSNAENSPLRKRIPPMEPGKLIYFY